MRLRWPESSLLPRRKLQAHLQRVQGRVGPRRKPCITMAIADLLGPTRPAEWNEMNTDK
jgi:hypothetical protein